MIGEAPLGQCCPCDAPLDGCIGDEDVDGATLGQHVAPEPFRCARTREIGVVDGGVRDGACSLRGPGRISKMMQHDLCAHLMETPGDRATDSPNSRPCERPPPGD